MALTSTIGNEMAQMNESLGFSILLFPAFKTNWERINQQNSKRNN